MKLALAGMAAALALSTSASAGTTVISVDGDGAVLHQPGSGRDLAHTPLGYGYGLRIGRQIGVPLLQVTPELGASVHQLGGASTVRGFAGARVSVGAVLMPSIYAHAGWTFVSDDVPTGFAPDVGAALDLNALPVLGLGIHGGHTFSGPGVTTFGAHASLKF